jgi:hypothetical protein
MTQSFLLMVPKKEVEVLKLLFHSHLDQLNDLVGTF